MGTNYYLRYNICKHCGRYNEFHIGKSSMGWTFTFQYINELVNPENFDPKQLLLEGSSCFNIEIYSYEKWKEVIQKYVIEYKTAKIFDEYNDEIDPDELFNLIDSKKSEDKNHADYVKEHNFMNDSVFKDQEGNSFSKAEFS